MAEIKIPKKLIEVALPLDDINVAAGREKSIRHGHPSTLHLWWARRPLAAARAVIFAQMVNDPGYERYLGRGMNKKDAALERERLFQIIRDLVKWENTNNEEVLNLAREEIRKSWRETCELNKNHPQAAELFNPARLPAFHDPFAGGGTIPLEAQRLGLETYASDLNPVAVTINKAMIEIPPKFANRVPIGPLPDGEEEDLLHENWTGAKGLAEDVRRYGAWMRAEAEKRIGRLYPTIKITADMVKERADLSSFVGQELTVVAWLWARTVHSPNPAFSHVSVPLVSSFVLSVKSGKEFWVEPVIEENQYRFVVRTGKPPKEAVEGTKVGRGGHFKCLFSGTPIHVDHIKEEGCGHRMGQRLLAIVVEGPNGRTFLSPDDVHEKTAQIPYPAGIPETEINYNPRDIRAQLYGLMKYKDLFSPRQLTALTTYSDLVGITIEKIKTDAARAGMPSDDRGLDSGGFGAKAYGEAIGVYLGLGVGRSTNYWSSLNAWGGEFIVQVFGRQAIPMVWDYAEVNPFSASTGNWTGALEWIERVIANALPASAPGTVTQNDAQNQTLSCNKLVSTDPPYYDNIGYADLSDYFYVWLRKSLRSIFPDLFATLAVPKAEELVATPYRHGTKEKAGKFFLDGMTQAMQRISDQGHPGFPVTIYYAFKQSESDAESGTANTGWDTFLEAVIRAGFLISGTWPMRTERDQGLKTGSNVLASSIILVCRKRSTSNVTISRREFVRELNAALPDALDEMTCGGLHSPVAPVDLSQAIIGPGMAIFSKYTAVLEADGKPMTVRTALQLINRFLSEDEFDHDTQFCLHWFESFGWGVGKFGEADVLARAKGTSVDGVYQAGILESGSGSVRLLKFPEYPKDWTPEGDQRMPIWEALHHLIRVLRIGGEGEAGKLFARIHKQAEPIRALAYRLYTLCERKGWAEDARAYNDLVTSWSQIEAASHKEGRVGMQAQMDFTEDKK